MRVTVRFLSIQALWTVPLVLLPATIALAAAQPLSIADLIGWTGKAIVMASFPAGIAVAARLLELRAVRGTLPALLLAVLAGAFAVFALNVLVIPLLSGSDRTLLQLARDMRLATTDWETRNDAAWRFYSAFFEPMKAVLLALIGLQVGIWARFAVPRALHGVLYWATGLGLLLSGYAVFDTTYEGIVIRTASDVSFAAFYTLLIPVGICAGFALPTLALLRGADIRGAPVV